MEALNNWYRCCYFMFHNQIIIIIYLIYIALSPGPACSRGHYFKIPVKLTQEKYKNILILSLIDRSIQDSDGEVATKKMKMDENEGNKVSWL